MLQLVHSVDLVHPFLYFSWVKCPVNEFNQRGFTLLTLAIKVGIVRIWERQVGPAESVVA